ncbi:MAG: ribosome biogenesis GTPase YlqF [Paenibacillaceae bacterium]|nr:ribosome biogenesis GTPase YlqF [Paenibacillaceae bacterium]
MIQWFPGHMAKAKRQLEAMRSVIDIVLELVDARIPKSSRNPILDEVFARIPRLVVMNKADLAHPESTEAWMRTFSQEGVAAVASDLRSPTKLVFARCQRLLAPLYAQWHRKGMRPRPVRAVVVGIPNVGKSTWINRFVRQSATKTGNRPGVTKGTQWVRVHEQMELLDSPGLLWPKFDDARTGMMLAAIGSVGEHVYAVSDVARWVLDTVGAMEPQHVIDRYGVVGSLHEIGARRGALRAHGIVDEDQAARIVLRDFRAGLLGRCSLEVPVSDG